MLFSITGERGWEFFGEKKDIIMAESFNRGGVIQNGVRDSEIGGGL